MTRNITTFMTWFVGKFIELATWCYSQLDSIQIGTTTLLRIMITITLLSLLIPVILSVGKGIRNTGERVIKK